MNSPGYSVSEKVVARIAECEGVDELELSEPLYQAVDTDALESIFRKTRGTVTFEYHGYEVRVDHDGHVEVRTLSGESLDT